MAGELKHYEKLTPHERFVLMVEAMARHDDREADRLEQTCPPRVYRMPDAQYQDRMRHAYVMALRYCLNTSDAVARLRMARMFVELHEHFAAGPMLLAEAAFLFGRAYARWEAGEIDEVGMPDLEALRAEVMEKPDLGRQIEELREVAVEATRQVAETLTYAVEKAHVAELRAQQDGFASFCRDTLGVEAETVLEAFGRGAGQPHELEEAGRDIVTDEEASASAATSWHASWTRRFR